MNKETKNIIQLLAFMLPMIGLLVFGWLNSSMLAETKAEQRLAAQIYLIKTQYDSQTMVDRQELIDHYKFTNDEIDSSHAVSEMIEYFKDQRGNK